MGAGKGIIGHGNGAPQQPDLTQTKITRKVEFLGAQVVVASMPSGNRLLSIIDPGSQTVYQVELAPAGARSIGKELVSAIDIAGADEMPGAD